MISQLHPEKWRTDWKELESSEIKDDETIRFLLCYQLKHGQENNHTIYIIFTVTRKENKVYGRITISQGNDERYSKGHAVEIVEYNIGEEENLIKEMEECALGIALKSIEEGRTTGVNLNTDQEVLRIITPKNSTNEILMQKILEKEELKENRTTEIVLSVLGLDKKEKQTIPNENLLKSMKVLPPKEKKSETTEEEEKNLIKQFGKNRMEKLAKEMKWKGKIINNK